MSQCFDITEVTKTLKRIKRSEAFWINSATLKHCIICKLVNMPLKHEIKENLVYERS